MRALALILLLAAAPALAESVVPLRAIRADARISPADVTLATQVLPGAVARIEDVVGMEARVTLYPGRPILPSELAPPAIVERNETVAMHYIAGPLRIEAEGRVLRRARPGDRLQVMNLQSRTTVWGVIRRDGVVEVGQ